MSYMAGDYYAGDYYAGGLFGNIFRGVTRTIGGAVSGFLKGGPIGAIGGAIGGAAAATRANIAHDVNDAATGGNPSTLPAVQIHTANPAVATFLRGGGRFSAAGKAKLTQMHAAAAAGVHPAIAAPMIMGRIGGRRMNWANGRALGRAERRIHAAVKHMEKYIRWVKPTKAGHAVPRFGRKKK